LLDVDHSPEPLQAFFRKRIRDRGEQLAERREARALLMSKVGANRAHPTEPKTTDLPPEPLPSDLGRKNSSR